MATQVTITQTKTVVDIDPPDGVYRFRLVSSVVIDSSTTGFTESEVFVLASDDDTYQHMATLGDYINFPTTKPNPPPPDFYRVSGVTIDFETLDAAVAEANMQITRLQNLITDWETYADNNWDGTTPTIITGA